MSAEYPASFASHLAMPCCWVWVVQVGSPWLVLLLTCKYGLDEVNDQATPNKPFSRCSRSILIHGHTTLLCSLREMCVGTLHKFTALCVLHLLYIPSTINLSCILQREMFDGIPELCSMNSRSFPFFCFKGILPSLIVLVAGLSLNVSRLSCQKIMGYLSGEMTFVESWWKLAWKTNQLSFFSVTHR